MKALKVLGLFVLALALFRWVDFENVPANYMEMF